MWCFNRSIDNNKYLMSYTENVVFVLLTNSKQTKKNSVKLFLEYCQEGNNWKKHIFSFSPFTLLKVLEVTLILVPWSRNQSKHIFFKCSILDFWKWLISTTFSTKHSFPIKLTLIFQQSRLFVLATFGICHTSVFHHINSSRSH